MSIKDNQTYIVWRRLIVIFYSVVSISVHNSLSELILVIVGVGCRVCIIKSLGDAGIVGVRHWHRHVGLRWANTGDTAAKGCLLWGDPGQPCTQTLIYNIDNAMQ